MALTEEFDKAITVKNTRMIRIMLKDSLVVDPTFEEFNKMVSIAENNLNDLYDEHDGEKLNFDSSSWTKDYMNEQMVQVVYNFSKERLNLLKSICKNMYKGRANKIEAERVNTREIHRVTQKQVGTGVVISGVVIATVGVAISEPLVIGVGALAIVVGGIIIILGE